MIELIHDLITLLIVQMIILIVNTRLMSCMMIILLKSFVNFNPALENILSYKINMYFRLNDYLMHN